jgi:hypothetical protein
MGLDVRHIVEEEPRDRDVLEILIARGGRADAAELLAELVVVGVLGQLDLGE